MSKANASGNQDEVQNAVSQALIVGFGISILGSILMLRFPEKVLSSVLKGEFITQLLFRPTRFSHFVLPSLGFHLAEGAPALQYARPYLFIRSFAFLPSLISLIGFSAFRGMPYSIVSIPFDMLSSSTNAYLFHQIALPLRNS